MSGNLQVGDVYIEVAIDAAGSDRAVRTSNLLTQLDADWRTSVRGSIGGYETGKGYRLARERARDDLVLALEAATAGLLIYGSSGVGKSALIIDAVHHATRKVFGLNLRHLPASPVDLAPLLGIPLSQALSEMSLSSAVLVIDGADSVVEGRSDMLAHVLQAAKTASVPVAIVANEDCLSAVRDVVLRAIGTASEHLVEGLDDSEVESIAAEFPHVRRLAGNPQSRELLRRPAVADLLVRAETDGLPLTEADAMREVWLGLVRRNEHSDRGRPEARERVMRQLARQQLDGQPAETVLDQLDDDAVAGLRRDGLLRSGPDLAWQPMPDFAHDLLRNYALAHVLLADGHPATRLKAGGAPRWALPAARLACQALLTAAADRPGQQPLEQRFLRFQETFTNLVTDGLGDRWADVPSEALLTAGRDGATLSSVWPAITRSFPEFGVRLLRLLDQRHRLRGVVDPLIASPVITCLLDHGAPDGAADKTAEVIREWEFSLILADTPAGHGLRIRLREQLVDRCREATDRLEREKGEIAAQLAARTPEEVAADEARIEQFRLLTSERSGRGTPRARRVLPHELTDAVLLEQFALLGRDLGDDGAALLRDVADHAPHFLAPALEEIGTGRALHSFSPALLRELVTAYYIDDRGDADGFGSSYDPLDDGIRDHHWRGPFIPPAAFYRGPFQFLLRGGFREGVAVINRILNVAAHHRVSTLTSLRFGQERGRSAEAHELRIVLDGTERRFVGDEHVWAWYRGTSVGPYPCMSALQAVELACDQLIEQGFPLGELVPLLLNGCENLAMVGLVVGILVRHIEASGIALDPFLAEPEVWALEFSRSVGEHGGLASSTPGIVNADRREWSLREAATFLTVRASGSRAEELRKVGERLEEAARQGLEPFRPESDDVEQIAAFEEVVATRLAKVRAWAAALDQSRYRLTRQFDGSVEIVAVPPDDVVHALKAGNEDLARGNQAYGLLNRYGSNWRSLVAEPVPLDELARDIATARALYVEPSRSGPINAEDGPAALAAYVIRAMLQDGQKIESEDVVWAARLLIDVVDGIRELDPLSSETAFFDWGADRSAARALPLLLLPQATHILHALDLDDDAGRERLYWILHRLGTDFSLETRLFLAGALDAVWCAPCQANGCHHRVALSIVEDSARRCSLGEWHTEEQRHKSAYLEGDLAEAIVNVAGDKLIVPRLSPAIRAAGPASLNGCRTGEAAKLLSGLLDAHARGMTGRKYRYRHSRSDSLVVARALMTLASADDDSGTYRYLTACAQDMDALAEFVHALAAAAEETPTLADAARRVWPKVMSHVLDFFDAKPFPNGVGRGYAQAVAALVPKPAYDAGYLHRELHGQLEAWTALLDWEPQIERWVGRAAGMPDCVDSLVTALRAVPRADQVRLGLVWVETLTIQDVPAVARGSWFLPDWLRELQADVHGEAKHRWQRIVDVLTVAGDSRLSDLVD